MIYFLTTKRHDYTVRGALETECAALADCVQPLCYGRAFLMKRLPAGIWIFSDIERLDERDRRRAQRIRDCLAESPACRVLNDPQHSWRRFQLLRTLHRQGVNKFDVHRLSGNPRPARFPVFVRGENDHQGAQSSLLHSQAELDELTTRLDRSRWGREGMIATEFCDVSDDDGVFRKYSAFRIGEQLIPRHLFFSDKWCVKAWKLLDPRLLDEERRYIRDNPHRDQLLEIFQQARIDFGRVDYGVVGGRIQIWEINTNPMLPVSWGGGGEARQGLHDAFRQRFIEVMRALDSPGQDGWVEMSRRAVPLWAAAGLAWRSATARYRQRAA